MNKCDYCGRQNEDKETACLECGTAFPSTETAESGLHDGSENPAAAADKRRMVRGAFWFIGGAAVTAITYAAAQWGTFGGTYVVAWGAMLYGAFQWYTGWKGNEERAPEETAYAELTRATALEARGHIQEALLAYKGILERNPNSAAAQDAKKSMESLWSQLRPPEG
jgi:hypothetical protein